MPRGPVEINIRCNKWVRGVGVGVVVVSLGRVTKWIQRVRSRSGGGLCLLGGGRAAGSELTLALAGDATFVEARGAEEEARGAFLGHEDFDFDLDLDSVHDAFLEAALALHREGDSVCEVIGRLDTGLRGREDDGAVLRNDHLAHAASAAGEEAWAVRWR
jgi:hypothetical protein